MTQEQAPPSPPGQPRQTQCAGLLTWSRGRRQGTREGPGGLRPRPRGWLSQWILVPVSEEALSSLSSARRAPRPPPPGPGCGRAGGSGMHALYSVAPAGGLPGPAPPVGARAGGIQEAGPEGPEGGRPVKGQPWGGTAVRGTGWRQSAGPRVCGSGFLTVSVCGAQAAGWTWLC